MLPFLLPKSIKKPETHTEIAFQEFSRREEGIRTLDTLPYTHFPGVLLQPLGHLSIWVANVLKIK